jgi:nucleotide-binding universal stress UspA family protein
LEERYVPVLCPIPKILVPVDDTRESRRAVEYAGCLSSPYGEGLRGITLAHVIGSGYFTRHAGYKDLRVLRLEESEALRRLRQVHYGTDILPILDVAAGILHRIGVPDEKIGRVILHGKAWREVLDHAGEGEFSTIVLGRSTAEEGDSHELGSVAQTIVQRATGIDVYVVGKRILENMACPMPRILIAIDGSPNSMAAIEHALCMAQAVKGVLDVAVLCVKGAEVSDTARVFQAAREAAAPWEFPGDRIRFVVREGDPGKEIAAEAELGEYTTLIMGRRGHTGDRHLSMGAAPLTVIHRTVSPTIAIISS